MSDKNKISQKGYKKYFFDILKSEFPENFKAIFQEIENKYDIISNDTNFSFNSKNPLDKRLDFANYFLSFIQVLDKKGLSYEKINTISLEIATNYVKPKNKFQAWLKKLPAKLTNTLFSTFLLKKINNKIGEKRHENGFVAEIITDKKETYGLGYGINIIECGICKLFDKNNATKYKSILCEVDKITSNLAGLELIRTGTIANGAKICDFRFKKLG